jgi:hypothetical protein
MYTSDVSLVHLRTSLGKHVHFDASREEVPRMSVAIACDEISPELPCVATLLAVAQGWHSAAGCKAIACRNTLQAHDFEELEYGIRVGDLDTACAGVGVSRRPDSVASCARYRVAW